MYLYCRVWFISSKCRTLRRNASRLKGYDYSPVGKPHFLNVNRINPTVSSNRSKSTPGLHAAVAAINSAQSSPGTDCAQCAATDLHSTWDDGPKRTGVYACVSGIGIVVT